MADTLLSSSSSSSKRLREETQLNDTLEDSKRHKPSSVSYNHILSLLDEEEEDPTQDLSNLIFSLQQELSDSSHLDLDPTLPETSHQDKNAAVAAAAEDYPSSSCGFFKEEEEGEEEKERVIRHLLEASDDELGIPNRAGADAVELQGEGGGGGGDGFVNDGGDDGFSFSDGLWEFEDVTANYYALLQSELFM